MEKRFTENVERHKNIRWENVLAKLEENRDKLIWMEETGGEPDFLIYNDNQFIVDMTKESPEGRRSLCYDRQARLNRKKFPPKTSALEECKEHNVCLMNLDLYNYIQTIEPMDLKTSSWILTDVEVRQLGGALFCDRRYDKVFVYHNGADSYYGVRGFRTYFQL